MGNHYVSRRSRRQKGVLAGKLRSGAASWPPAAVRDDSAF